MGSNQKIPNNNGEKMAKFVCELCNGFRFLDGENSVIIKGGKPAPSCMRLASPIRSYGLVTKKYQHAGKNAGPTYPRAGSTLNFLIQCIFIAFVVETIWIVVDDDDVRYLLCETSNLKHAPFTIISTIKVFNSHNKLKAPLLRSHARK